MNATCPRCGAVSLAGAHSHHLTCKVCRLRYCTACLNWKQERKQSYCGACGAAFSLPPSAMPWRVLLASLYVPILLALMAAALAPASFWTIMCIAVLLPLIYSAIYLVVFYRRTSLTQATRREALLLLRRAATLAVVIYFVVALGNSTALTVTIVVTLALIAMGVYMRRLDAEVIRELQTNRRKWEAVLSRSTRDVLLMRFPPIAAG